MRNPGEYRSLWFIVYGDPSPASQVNVHIDLKIDGLKKAINEERVRLNCPRLSTMLLWKPNTPISVSNFGRNALDTSFVRFPDPDSANGFDRKDAVQPLDITDTVFRHWRECPDETQLQIIAQELPVEGSYLDTLAHLRRHLWGRNRLNIVSADGKSYSTIDLTLFDLPQLNPRSTKILLLRDEYILAYNAIRKQVTQGRSIFLIIGQPGIGKTLFLLCLLVCLLQEQIPVALQIDAHEFVLFDNRGVRSYQTISRYASVIPNGAWTLSDSSGEQQLEPCAAFKYSKAHIIHTSPLAAHRWKGWEKQLGATRYIMDVWPLEELRGLLTVSNLDIQRGVHLFRKYGSNVRAIVDILNKPAKEDTYLTDVRAGASNFATDFSAVLSDLRNLDFGSKDSSKIFTVRPDNSVSRQPVLRIPTSFLAATLGLALARQGVAQQHAAFTMLSKHPSLHTAAGWLFENYAHVVLSDPSRAPLPTYIRNESDPPSIPAPNEMKSGSTALKNIQPPFSFYWRPRESNFEGLDAIIRHDNTVWGLQYTIRAKYGSVTEGLTQVRKDMNHKQGVKFRVAMLGLEQAGAESARDKQKLTGTWKNTPISACVLPMGNVDERLLQNALDEASDSYPEDQSRDLGVPMDDESN